ncbi:MAG: sugar transferase [Clostridia bacterium]|nr:sugar transferase [Clostridia bacterium]MBR3817961.1 sugar transferase [Clostridia bacterium]
MILRKWEDLPKEMQIPEVKEYYDLLSKKKFQLVLKRIFDIVVSFTLLTLLSPLFIILAIAIKLDSKGPVFYRQTRVTQYGEEFRIFKFRSMVTNADKGSLLTVGGDSRITKTGKFIRKYKLDEFSQLIDVLRGTMTFVGTRPEVPKYVEKYTPEMMATLLMPAGITSEASVYYKDENELLDAAEDVEKTYLEVVLPDKMKYNLAAIKSFSFIDDIKVMILTALAVFK